MYKATTSETGQQEQNNQKVQESGNIHFAQTGL